MADVPEASTSSPCELLGAGRRHLTVRDFNAAAESLALACEMLAKEHGDTADQCAEAYLWYGKALLGLAREESGVLGDGMPGTGNDDDGDGDSDDDEAEKKENGENKVESKEVAETNKEEKKEAGEERKKIEGETGDAKVESTTTEEKPETSSANKKESNLEQPSTSNGETNDESIAELGDDEVDNLQLAWEMLDLSRSILKRRSESGASGQEAARALLADVHLTLGEVALESETYDKAVIDMESCLEIQKELYKSDDRRIAETHYQIGLAYSLSSYFEDAITHFKNAANILETRIKILESPSSADKDATVKKFAGNDPFYTVEGEIKELKELLPEIQEKIQDMMDYKSEVVKRICKSLCPSNSEGSSSNSNGAGSSASSEPKQASDISHLIKRKRKSSEGGDAETSAPKKANT